MNQRDIAKLAGVSSATISRVINKDPAVSPELALKVLKVIQEHGYVQNAMARNLRMARSNTIGYLVPDIKNPFFTSMLAGFEEMCYSKGYDIIFQNTNENVDKELKSMQTLLKYRVDGLLATFVDSDNPYISAFESRGIPIVRIDRKSNKIMNNDCILVDNIGAMKQMVQHLTGFGHRKIAIIYGSTNITPGEERLNGFYSAMQEIGLPVIKEYVVPGYFTEDGSYEAVTKLLQLSELPTAIITTNNFSTMGAFKALRDKGVRIPEDISLIGLDNFPMAMHLTPPVTIVKRVTSQLGKMAAEMLLERIELGAENEKIPPRMIVVPTILCEGKSCSIPRE